MKTSTLEKPASAAPALPAALIAQMEDSARIRYATLGAWGAASGVPKETLSRLKRNPSCDLRTLEALARAAGCKLVAVPEGEARGNHVPVSLDRPYEESLLDLCASGSTDSDRWRALGPVFFMGGLAVIVAGVRGFDRERYLRLACDLHPGISCAEVMEFWLRQSPLRPARFLPMLKKRRGLA